MTRFRVVLAIVLVVACSSVRGRAQENAAPETGTPQVRGFKVRTLHPKPVRSPFPLDATGSNHATELEFLPQDKIKAFDHELIEASENEIERRARLAGLGYSAGADGWGYEQAVCPAFPNHIVLEYSRKAGPGDVSLFAAVVPRGTGHVRVIPVSRRGWTLFTPTGANALTIHDFNAIVREEGSGLSPDWMQLGLCYAALASGHVRAALLDVGPEQETFPMPGATHIHVSYRKAGALVAIESADTATDRRSWELRFNGHGELMKVALGKTASLRAVATKDKPLAPGKPVKASGVELAQ